MNHSNASSETSSVADGRKSAARERLKRLEGFLQQDMSNEALLVDAFETALSCGEWDRARLHLDHGQALPSDPLGWRLREGDFWLAQNRYAEAHAALEALSGQDARTGFAEVLLHNLAFIEFRQARYRECVARLAPTLELVAAGPAGPRSAVGASALQQLWLRALHQDGQGVRARDWALGAERHKQLDARAAGVASLIAVDLSDLATAQRWTAASFAGGATTETPLEALVAQAALALAARDTARAIQLADMALEREPEEGRAWSLRGFAALLARDPDGAHAAFARALKAMPTHLATWHGLGWAQVTQGDLPGARETFEKALSIRPEFAESHGALAVVLAMQRSMQDAASHAEHALRLDKNNASARHAQALLNGKSGSIDDLRRLYGGLPVSR